MFFSTETRPTYRNTGSLRSLKSGSRGVKAVEVDAACPQRHVCEAVALQFAFDRRGRRHHGRGRAVEVAQEAIGPAFGDAEHRGEVLRKARVVGRREGKVLLAAVAARCLSERSLGCDMDRGIRCTGKLLVEQRRKATGRPQRQADLAIAGARHRVERQRRDHRSRVAGERQLAIGGFDRAHHAVDLRMPGIGDGNHFHASAFSGRVEVGGVATSSSFQCTADRAGAS